MVAYINKKGGGDEIGLSMCPTVENPVLAYQETGDPQGTSHPWPAERDSRQAIQTWPDLFKQSGHFIQKYSKLYAPGGTNPRWTCLPPGSTTNHYSLFHRFQTPRHGQWMHWAFPGRTWTHMPSHQQPSLAKW